ncbi:hypothetical protein ABK040_011582 [Willaertia magna]
MSEQQELSSTTTTTTETTETTKAPSLYAESNDTDSPYRRVEKLYRKHHITNKFGKKVEAPFPDTSNVIDFHNTQNNTPENNEILQLVSPFPNTEKDMKYFEEALNQYNSQFEHDDELKQRMCYTKEELMNKSIYTLKGYPGFYLIKDLMTSEKQIYWIKQSLEKYPNPPNITNHSYKDSEIKDIFVRSNEGDEEAKDLLKRLAWCTLGYQYEWTSRKYHKERFVAFPDDIGSFVNLIACQCGYGPYIPEAAIVNFYSKDRQMGGHVDDAEYEMSKPIVSLSIGSKCIFLLGGETRDTEPKAIFLESGDCMIMGGRARYCFHGVARIIKDTIPDYLQSKYVDPKYKVYAEYMERDMMRVNINARQVFVVDEENKEK